MFRSDATRYRNGIIEGNGGWICVVGLRASQGGRYTPYLLARSLTRSFARARDAKKGGSKRQGKEGQGEYIIPRVSCI